MSYGDMHPRSLPDGHPAMIGLKAIADKHHITVAQMKERSRRAYLVAARREAYEYLAAPPPKGRGWSSTQIAAFFQKDHTTILWAMGRTGQSTTRRRKQGAGASA